jgi:hypothetical protein
VDHVELAGLIEKAVVARRVMAADTVEAVEEPLRTAAEAGAGAVKYSPGSAHPLATGQRQKGYCSVSRHFQHLSRNG